MSSILIVEDDSCIARTLAKLCSFSGYAASIATNGTDALEQIKQLPPDLIILDYMLPDIDGLEVLNRLRAVNHTLPVIIYTACEDGDAREKFQSAGATDFWRKSRIGAGEILEGLRAHLQLPVDSAAADASPIATAA